MSAKEKRSGRQMGKSNSNGNVGKSVSSVATLNSRAPLSKDLLQRLRSMTETLQGLKEENAALKATINNNKACNEDVIFMNNDLADLTRTELLSLASSQESEKNELVEAAQNFKENYLKYKNLAKRLKEERNHFRNAYEQKVREWNEVRLELDDMLNLVDELRGECEQLQLHHGPKDSQDKAVHVDIKEDIEDKGDEKGSKTSNEVANPSGQAQRSRRVRRTWTNFYKELEERQESPTDHEMAGRKLSLPTASSSPTSLTSPTSSSSLVSSSSEMRSQSLINLEENANPSRIRIARPWLKGPLIRAADLIPEEDLTLTKMEEESTEKKKTEVEEVVRDVLTEDQSMFTKGKVAAVREAIALAKQRSSKELGF